MKSKIYIYGLCNVFYDGYYIQGLRQIYGQLEFNVSKFPKFDQGTFAFIIENKKQSLKVIIDSEDSSVINTSQLEWSDRYGKVNYNTTTIPFENQSKILAIGPSFGIQIWNLIQTIYYGSFNFITFRSSITNKKEFLANYWRQFKRLRLKKYKPSKSSSNEVFSLNSIWKLENETNQKRALFINTCKSKDNLKFEGGFAARSNGDNLSFENLVYSKKIPLKIYLKKIKNSAFVFNTPAVVSCHGWKLAEFLALGKAIISTSHFNVMPSDLQNNIHVLYADDESQLLDKIDKLINNEDLKRNLEMGSRLYFDEYLAPEKVIKRLVENS